MESNKGTYQPDSDVHITFDDQQKINKFAQLNAKVEDLKDDLKSLFNDLQNLEDACDDISIMEDGSMVPYLFGEVFISQSIEDSLLSLEEAKQKKLGEIKDINEQCEKHKATMDGLKVHLYARFGSHINLENDEEE